MNGTAETIRRMIFDGGVINWIIIAEYVVMLAVVAERIVFYAATSYNRKLLYRRLDSLSERPASVQSVFLQKWPKRYERSAPLIVMREFAAYEKEDAAVLNEAVDRRVSQIYNVLNARLDILSLLANIAPLCGLLGTVTGLMAAFDQIQKLGGSVNIQALAGGIWSAMITTATGLIAAIPALAAGKLFELEMGRRMSDITVTLSLLKQLYRPDCLDGAFTEIRNPCEAVNRTV